MTDIVDNAVRSRYEVTRDGYTAELDYVIEGRRIVLLHTEVPEALEGRGLASRMVSIALDYARAQNLKVLPICPFAKGFIARHPEVTVEEVEGVNHYTALLGHGAGPEHVAAALEALAVGVGPQQASC